MCKNGDVTTAWQIIKFENNWLKFFNCVFQLRWALTTSPQGDSQLLPLERDAFSQGQASLGAKMCLTAHFLLFYSVNKPPSLVRFFLSFCYWLEGRLLKTNSCVWDASLFTLAQKTMCLFDRPSKDKTKLGRIKSIILWQITTCGRYSVFYLHLTFYQVLDYTFYL